MAPNIVQTNIQTEVEETVDATALQPFPVTHTVQYITTEYQANPEFGYFQRYKL
ncbi:hypothetical protein B0H13DRAFT_2348352 [Mycena leptocephala]|nr:hypothetical protein B0H13DRAFT_2348352 [Mycena leptocephala]